MKFRAIKCEPKKEAVECELDDSLESLQEAVGGMIELVYPFSDDVAILCNEEGKLEKLEFSRPLLGEEKEIIDLIAGTCYIIGLTDEGYRDLTDSEFNFYMEYFRYPIDVFRWVLRTDEGVDYITDFTPRNNDGRKVKAYGR